MREKIEDKLIGMGIMPNLKGFNYIVEAVEKIILDGRVPVSNIYKEIGKKYGESVTKIERTIRYARNNCKDCSFGKCNSEFLFCIALLVKREVEKNEN